MAASLTIRKSGLVEFAYLASDGAAWHGQGQEVQDHASIDDWIVAAGMDWRIQRGMVRYNVDRDGTQMMVPDSVVLFRSDNHHPLGIVSDRYQAVQPAETLEFFRDLANVGGFTMTAAGTLFDGARFWSTAKIGESAPVSVHDRIGQYLLVSSSADGSLATEVRLTTIRVVCNNTLSMARREGKAAVRVTHRSKFNAAEIHDALDLLAIDDARQQFDADMVKLAETPMRRTDADKFIIQLLSGAAKSISDEAADKVRGSSGYVNIMHLFDGGQTGSGLPGTQGTAYGMMQAVSEYTDHFTRARSADAAFASAQWGPMGILKDKAFETLLAMPSRIQVVVSTPITPAPMIPGSDDSFGALMGKAIALA